MFRYPVGAISRSQLLVKSTIVKSSIFPLLLIIAHPVLNNAEPPLQQMTRCECA